MLEKEPYHLARCIRTERIGIGAGRITARPCMAGTMNDPHLEHGPIGRVEVARPAVAVAARYPPILRHLPQLGRLRRLELLNDVQTVLGMHGRVLIAMKDNGRGHAP